MSARPLGRLDDGAKNSLARSECPACREIADARRLGEKHLYVLFQCGRCGAVFPRPAPVDVQVRSLYERYYERAEFVPAQTAIISLERVVKYAERFRRTGRWLDFGYGEGALLDIAEQRGWDCYGVEVSQRVLDYGRKRKWVVTSEPKADSRFRGRSFDVVTMVEFLEHVIDPVAFLNDAACRLRSGGLLYITTPNARGLNGRLLGLNWSVVSPPEHIVLWTLPALQSALTKAGFLLLRVRAEGLNPSEMLAAARWWKRETIVDRNRSAVALSEGLSRTRVRRAVKRVVNQGLNALRLGDTLKIWARRGG